MEKSSFFNAEIVGDSYDRVYLAEDYAEYFSSFIGNGVFPNPSTGLQVIANENMTVTLKPGKAWINGYMYENTDNYLLNVDIADGVLNRIDRVVLRLDFINREIKSYVKKGIFASSPVAPGITRDADMYEIALADIKINKGAIKITQAEITDLRLNDNLCGIVHGTVDQVDATTIFNQFQSWYSQTKDNYDNDIALWTQDKKDEFDTWYAQSTQAFFNEFNNWFNTIKGQLDGDIATNLANEINDLEEDLEEFKTSTNSQLDTKANETDNTRLTTSKTVTGAINELFTSASNGKTLVANAITNKGVVANEGDTFTLLAEKIEQISTGKKMARGTSNSNNTGILTISNLDFSPSLVIVSANDEYSTVLCSENFFNDDYQDMKSYRVRWKDGLPYSLTSATSVSNNTVTVNGFIVHHSTSSILSCEWMAYE